MSKIDKCMVFVYGFVGLIFGVDLFQFIFLNQIPDNVSIILWGIGAMLLMCNSIVEKFEKANKQKNSSVN